MCTVSRLDPQDPLKALLVWQVASCSMPWDSERLTWCAKAAIGRIIDVTGLWRCSGDIVCPGKNPAKACATCQGLFNKETQDTEKDFLE